MPRFDGARIALLEARMSQEMGDLVRRYGGAPVCVPAVREAALPATTDTTLFIDRLIEGAFSAVVFLTGVGVSALLGEADRQHRLPQTLEALRRTTSVCRGPKPSAVLRRNDVPVVLCAAEPFTTAELLDAMISMNLAGTQVALVHYGERDLPLVSALNSRGAQVHELCLYEWLMPADVEPLRALVRQLTAGEFDAVAFTSQIQCRHLFQIAAELGLAEALTASLNGRVIVAAIGPVCEAALRSLGVTPHVVPSNPKMVPMIAALADYFESRAIIIKES